MLGDVREGAVFPDERPGAGGKVQVAPAETRGGLEQLAQLGFEGIVAHGRDRFERKTGHGRTDEGGFCARRAARGVQAFRGGERVVGGRAGGGLAHGLTGKFLQNLDVVDDAAIDQQLGELYQVGLGAEGTKNGLALRAGKKSLVDA